MNEQTIQAFWQAHPCGDDQVGGLRSFDDYAAYFDAYDAFRYSNESHILDCLDGLHVAGKRVLEIGLGEGADAEQLIRRGARWSGVDLTAESVARVRTRLQTRHLDAEHLTQGSVLDLPFPDHSFDLVFSHGVLHHVPDIRRAQSEIHRVLRPDGELVVMLYARWSLNYLVSIMLLRRLALALLVLLTPRTIGKDADSKIGQHVQIARRLGLTNYLRRDEFLSRNTDGPLNPFSRVYDVGKVRSDFPEFVVERAYKRFMHAPPLPVARLPLERWLGWHLWVHLRPRGA